MLKKLVGNRFVSSFESDVVSFYRSKTDKRYVLDVVAPGFTVDDINVSLEMKTGQFKVALDPTRRPPLDYDGDPDNFGYNKIKMDNGVVNELFDIDLSVYDDETMQVTAYAGVFRISFEKKEIWNDIIVVVVD